MLPVTADDAMLIAKVASPDDIRRIIANLDDEKLLDITALQPPIRDVEEAILRHLDDISDLDPEERKLKRFHKYMAIGRYADQQQQAVEDQG